MKPGIHRYPNMDRVIYGTPFETALAAEVERLGAHAVYVLASGTLARETDTLDGVRRALGNRLAGVCTRIGAHTPRTDVVAAANEARAAKADLLVTAGGGSVTDASKMVGLCLGNDVTEPAQLDAFRAGPAADGSRPEQQRDVRRSQRDAGGNQSQEQDRAAAVGGIRGGPSFRRPGT
jgi:maleylacetate reductase